MSDYLYIDTESMKNLEKKFKVLDKRVRKASTKGLINFGLEIIADAQENLQKNKTNATSFLRNSGKVLKKSDDSVEAGFDCHYAGAVEFGRKAGGMPPVSMILQWLKKKRIGKAKDRQSIAWAIAQDIAANGTKAHPFLQPAYEKWKGRIRVFMQNVINEEIKKL